MSRPSGSDHAPDVGGHAARERLARRRRVGREQPHGAQPGEDLGRRCRFLRHGDSLPRPPPRVQAGRGATASLCPCGILRIGRAAMRPPQAAVPPPCCRSPLPARAQQPVTVFAAASLHGRAARPRRRTGRRAATRRRASPSPPPPPWRGRSSRARRPTSSSSADEPWMDYLQQRGLIVPATRVSPLGNALVLVAPADARAAPVALARGTDLAALLGPDGRHRHRRSRACAGRPLRRRPRWTGWASGSAHRAAPGARRQCPRRAAAGGARRGAARHRLCHRRRRQPAACASSAPSRRRATRRSPIPSR